MLTVTIHASILSIRLTDEHRSTWMRLVMPDGSISDVTSGPYCACVGLSRQTVTTVNVDFLPGLRVEFSDSMAGPWVLAATTQAPTSPPGTPPAPATGSALIVADTSLVTTSLTAGTVSVQLTNDGVGTWMRLRLKDGSVSPLTVSPTCACIAMGGNSPHVVRFGALPGVRVEVSRQMHGPWILAASVN